MIQIRLSTPADRAGVEALLNRSYPTLLASAYPAELLARTLPVMTRANPGLLASGRYFVAERGDQIIGCGGWSWEAPGTGNLCPGLIHIRHFAADPLETRQGIARRLFQACLAQARNEGATMVEALSTLSAEPFYQRMGLTRQQLRDVPMGHAALPSIVMHGPIP